MLRVALVTATVVLAVPAVAQAHWDLAADGNPLITTSSLSEEQLQLSVCPPAAGACTPVAWTNGEYRPGETAPGTTFEIEFNGVPERSPAWQGKVTNTAPPTIAGGLYVTGDALPQAGTWSGGWGDDVSGLAVAGCATPAGTDCRWLPQLASCPVPCETVTEPASVNSGPAGIALGYAGRYLFTSESRLPRDQRGWPSAVPLLWSAQLPFDLAPASALRSVSAPVGPLGLPTRVPEPEPKVAPTATLRTKALRSKGKISVGRVTCAETCTVAVRVSGGGRKSYVTSFTARGLKAITAPVRRGKLTVRVRVDGKLLANGKVRAR